MPKLYTLAADDSSCRGYPRSPSDPALWADMGWIGCDPDISGTRTKYARRSPPHSVHWTDPVSEELYRTDNSLHPPKLFSTYHVKMFDKH